MDYYEIDFTLAGAEDYQRDLLIDAMAGLGSDTFEETEAGFKAYIPSADFDEEALKEQLAAYEGMLDYTYQVNLIPQKNWNEAWESNFEPIEIQEKIFVRATFHTPREGFPYEIVIDPKMAFGTGHHQTTSMMLELMLDEDFAGKQVLDMGCGTGILAIMASKLGAGNVTAIDYDPVCYDSTLENATLNKANNITALCGSKEAIPDALYDVILANINRNILLDQMARYAEILMPNGVIFFSGFYETPDLDIIKEAAATYNLVYDRHLERKDWVAARFVKR
ncbi:50S ribosomal protein L11 methyltransferase [Mucilaginibacter roseus]|uniref:Ribosomal protein L11 methyltransferase n=1 Tax=Mucilaginibacter roseus TaxID=1528868 RepID=A0ABS8U001_9SPHI|nr:50S ribosomal protein L11 methyltransferase [Mucilaginibacter roseus]MCD8739187.1 50S ribosomal protein L11 methyltransferase [Mucilaginibacter roseus]